MIRKIEFRQETLDFRYKNMQFDAAGPFPFDPNSKDKQWRKDFWDEVEESDSLEGLDLAIGCYVFCIKHNGRTLPWYVGQAKGQKGFKGEIFQDSKVMRYKEVPAIKYKYKGARAEMVLFPLVTATYRRVAKNRTEPMKKAIAWLEKELIIHALSRNSKLINVSDTLHAKNMSVRGLFGQQPPGQPTKAARYVKNAVFDLE